MPLDAVIDFKRLVYQMALVELARILFRSRAFDMPESYRVAEPEAPLKVVLGRSPP